MKSFEEEVQSFMKEYKKLCKEYNISLAFYLGDLEIHEYDEDDFLRIEYEIEDMLGGE